MEGGLGQGIKKWLSSVGQIVGKCTTVVSFYGKSSCVSNSDSPLCMCDGQNLLEMEPKRYRYPVHIHLEVFRYKDVKT